MSDPTSTRVRTNGASPSAPLDGTPPAASRPPASPPKLRRRPWLAMVSIMLVTLGGVAAWWLVTSSSTAEPVLAVARTVDRGTVIEDGDLIVATVAPDPALRTVPASNREEIVGQRATADLSAGSLLTPGSVAAGLVPEQGQSLVGIPVTDGQIPSTALRPGDAVRLVATPRAGDDLPEAPPEAFDATVVTTDVIEETGAVVVDVTVPTDSAARVAALAGTGRVVIVLDPREQ